MEKHQIVFHCTIYVHFSGYCIITNLGNSAVLSKKHVTSARNIKKEHHTDQIINAQDFYVKDPW